MARFSLLYRYLAAVAAILPALLASPLAHAQTGNSEPDKAGSSSTGH